MKKYILFTFIVFSLKNYSQSKIAKSVDSILINSHRLYDPEYEIKLGGTTLSFKDKKDYLDYIMLLRNFEELETKFNGKIEIGFQGYKVKNSDNFIMSTRINLDKGIFPFQYKVNLGLRNQIRNGSVNESVSDVLVALDYNYNNSLKNEFYTFIKRSTNTYLGISQRYEVGAGHIFNFYSSKKGNPERGLTKEGQDKMKMITENPIVKKMANSSIFYACTDSICKKLNINNKNTKNIKESTDRVEQIIRKSHSTTRLSLALGINYEIDKRKGPLNLYDSESTIKKWNFNSSGLYRLVLRPMVTWQNNNFTFNSGSYFKLALSDSQHKDVCSPDNLLKNQLTDYRIEFNNSLRVQFSKKTSLVVRYNILYENAPPRKYFLNNNSYELFKADNKYSEIILSLEMNI